MTFSVVSKMDRPISGTGIGLRHCHIGDVLQDKPDVPWFELLADNHLEAGGPVKKAIESIRQDYPFTFHCVGMSLGGFDPLNLDYLHALKTLMQTLEPIHISDHVSFSSVNGRHYHELLPLPYTEESLQHLSQRIQQVQEILGQRMLVENVSSYVSYTHSTIPEWEFFAALAEHADCELLLDVNNIYVNSINHQFDYRDYLTAIPYQRVREIHLAGFDDRDTYLLDAHNNRVADAVWTIFNDVMQQAPNIPALIEWDNDLPDFSVLQDEACKAEAIRQQYKQQHLRQVEVA
ncbi:MAG: DUF692 domain-containing protein [Gammaproteobacteria bacterium]|nr:DUF692 domain-containing protein [Gammaproteobacteria bacterium]